MNIHSIIGLVLATVVLIVGLFLSTNNISMFVDYPSMFIVVGGTVASTAISFQLNRIVLLFKVFTLRMLKRTRCDYAKVIEDIIKISETYRKGKPLTEHVERINDYFLKECLNLIEDGILEDHEFMEVINDRVENLYYDYMEDAERIKGIGKFPPAFGMMGTTIGMIVLLSNLGGEDAMKMIGPAMAVCLITTLYGVVIANLAIIPISENLVDSAKELYLKNKIIVEGMRLMKMKPNPIVMAERLNSYLRPGNRLDWKEVLSKGQ